MYIKIYQLNIEFKSSHIVLVEKVAVETYLLCVSFFFVFAVLLVLQEMSSLGLPSVWMESTGSSELNVVAVLNCMYDLIQLHRRGLRTLENMEVEQLKSSSNVDYLQFTSTRLKVQ